MLVLVRGGVVLNITGSERISTFICAYQLLAGGVSVCLPHVLQPCLRDLSPFFECTRRFLLTEILSTSDLTLKFTTNLTLKLSHKLLTANYSRLTIQPHECLMIFVELVNPFLVRVISNTSCLRRWLGHNVSVINNTSNNTELIRILSRRSIVHGHRDCTTW